jgi:hypothetical protein
VFGGINVSQLNAIYEDIEIYVEKKYYMVLPNEMPAVTKLLADARILSYDRLMVAWEILTFKHDERNPFPSHEKLMKLFRVGKRAMMNAVSDIVKTGLFINEKGKYEGMDKRKNTYNVSNFLNLIACIVEAIREDRDIDIKQAYKDVVAGKLKAKKVSSEAKEVETPKEEKVTFSEAIETALDNAKESRRKTLKNIVQENIERLDEETLVYLIGKVDKLCTNEHTLSSYASRVFGNASNGEKQKDEQSIKEQSKTSYKGNTGRQKATRTEIVPSWHSGVYDDDELRYQKIVEDTHVQLLLEYEKAKEVKIRKYGGEHRITEHAMKEYVPAYLEWANNELASQNEFDTLQALGEHRLEIETQKMYEALRGFRKEKKAN